MFARYWCVHSHLFQRNNVKGTPMETDNKGRLLLMRCRLCSLFWLYSKRSDEKWAAAAVWIMWSRRQLQLFSSVFHLTSVSQGYPTSWWQPRRVSPSSSSLWRLLTSAARNKKGCTVLVKWEKSELTKGKEKHFFFCQVGGLTIKFNQENFQTICTGGSTQVLRMKLCDSYKPF